MPKHVGSPAGSADDAVLNESPKQNYPALI
jgi:hypothetical protein